MRTFLKSMLTIFAIYSLSLNTASSQTQLFFDDFDGPESAVVPEGWTQVPGSLHEAASEDPDFDWKAVNSARYSILDPNSGDQVRDIMGYYRRDPLLADGSPLLDNAIGSLFGLERPPLSGSIQWERMSGSRAPWKNPPFFTMGEQPDGTYPETARVLVADSDEYGGTNMNIAIDSPAIDLQGSAWVRVNYDSFLTANQDQSAGSWYKLDDGPWQPLVLSDNYIHGNDQAYAGPYSFAIKTDGASTIQVRWWLAGDFSWFWAIDNVEVVGYSGVPEGPAKPSIVSPDGVVTLADFTTMQSSAYNDPSGGSHVFSEWEVTEVSETYGNLVSFNEDSFLIDYPILRTGIQPNEFALNAVNPDDVRGSNDQNARDEDAPHNPILFGREQPGAQFEIDLAGDLTVLNVPEYFFRPGLTYKARVRHWNNNGLASPWSDDITFSVAPVAADVVFEEKFDGEGVYDRLSAEGWDVGWFDLDLGLLQIHGDDLQNLNDTETDGRGLHGLFSGGVLHSQDAFTGLVTTPVIDNSNGGPLTLIVDSSWRTSLEGTISVVINGQATTLMEVGNAQILANHPEFGGSLLGDQMIYNNTYVLTMPETANQSNVQFQFDKVDGTFWTIDNLTVMSGEPAEVGSWALHK